MSPPNGERRACVTDLSWRKSSCSGSGNNCVELAWRKSSRSTDSGNCVELAVSLGGAAVRDSKNPDGPILLVPAQAIAALVTHLDQRPD
jgi:hypothetical protein